MVFLVLSLFMVDPAPLDMPQAESFLVREGKSLRLEDRYDRMDLWLSQTVVGRWTDESDRLFLLSALGTCPPSVDRSGTQTRVDYEAQKVPMRRVRANADFPAAFRDAIAILAPCDVLETPRSPRQLPRGYKEVCYWQHPTNLSDIVCTFLPERTNVWFLASWKLAPEDDYPTQVGTFEDRFLKADFPSFVSRLKPFGGGHETLDGRRERELLRRDAHHSIAAYSNWRFTGAEEFVVLDDLPMRDFVTALTNDLSAMRAKYAASVPTPIDGSNVLCVARIYASRDEYLTALATDGMTNMAWSAAYWSPLRRELVAHLPENGERELLKTVRHEAFHQYLSYAASMVSVSPWLNEGYAQYFEDDESREWELDVDRGEEGMERLAKLLPGVLAMDYDRFYEGTDFERRLKYRLAWSLAVFLEKGADKVRFRPFANLKRDYFAALFETHDMQKATSAAFKSEDTLKLFVAEWKKFWEGK